MTLVFGLALVGGCAASGEESSPPPVAPAAPQMEPAPAPKPEPVKADKKKGTHKKPQPAKAEKSHRTEADIRAELDRVGHKLASQAARTITPSKASKHVAKSGNGYVASYIEIDPNTVSTHMKPGSHKGTYVGFVRYKERFMECRGADKKAALSSTHCKEVKTRNLNEMIHFDGKSWKY